MIAREKALANLRRFGLIKDKDSVDAQVEQIEHALNGSQTPAPIPQNLELQNLQDMSDGRAVATKPMSAEKVASLEKELGRELTRDEKFYDRVERGFEIKQTFKPVLAGGEEDPIDATIREYELKVAQDRLNAMPENEAGLHLAKQAKADNIAKTKSSEELTAHLSKVKDQLDALDNLRREALSDSLYTNSDLALIDAAYRQLSTPNNDPETASVLLGEVNAIAPRHLQIRRDGLTAHLLASGLNEAEASEIVGKRLPDAEAINIGGQSSGKQPADNAKLELLQADWFAKSEVMESAQTTFKALKADAASDPAAVNAARETWKAATQECIAASEVYQAAKPAAE